MIGRGKKKRFSRIEDEINNGILDLENRLEMMRENRKDVKRKEKKLDREIRMRRVLNVKKFEEEVRDYEAIMEMVDIINLADKEKKLNPYKDPDELISKNLNYKKGTEEAVDFRKHLRKRVRKNVKIQKAHGKSLKSSLKEKRSTHSKMKNKVSKLKKIQSTGNLVRKKKILPGKRKMRRCSEN